MASKIKADQFETLDGSGNITLNNSVTMASTKTLPAASLTGALPAISAAALTSIPAGNLTGTVADARISTLTASKLTGALPAISGANLTGVTSTTINNNADNRVITGSGTANTLEGESGLTFNGTVLHTNAGTSGASTHAASRIRIEDDTHCGIEITTPNTSEQYIMFSDPQGQAGEIKYAHASDLMQFNSTGSHKFVQGATTHMEIDSNGFVKTPKTPVFRGRYSTEASTTGISDLIYQNQEIDVGSCYNPSNGRFTAPVSGYYYLTAMLGTYKNGSARGISLRMHVNGGSAKLTADSFLAPAPSSNAHTSNTVSGILLLAANDYVHMSLQSHSTYSFTTYPAEGRGNFSGFMITAT